MTIIYQNAETLPDGAGVKLLGLDADGNAVQVEGVEELLTASDAAVSAASTATTQAASAVAAAATATAARDATLVAKLAFASKSALDAALAYDANTAAAVIGDASAANDGIYRKTGASGSGSWTRVGPLAFDSEWVGLVNGWPDPYFRLYTAPSGIPVGTRNKRNLYWDNGVPAALASWAVVENAVYPRAKALRKTGPGNLSGPRIWVADAGWKVDDTIKVVGWMVAGPAGGSANFVVRGYSAGGAAVTAQVFGLTDGGSGSVALGAAAQRMVASITIVDGVDYIAVFPAAISSGQQLDLVALAAIKAAAAPTRAPVAEDVTLLGGLLTTQVAATAGVTEYAATSRTVVTAASETIAITGSGYSTSPRDLTFSGWGERYSPAGVSFNAIRVVSVTRTTPPAKKWRTINAVVRTGDNAHASGSTLVAVGSVSVDPDAATLTDLTILLRDPSTGAVKTLTDADFSGGEYFLGIYALAADGTPAACGEPRGTLPNTLGQSYYITTASPLSSEWSVYVSNLRVGFRHVLLTTPAEAEVYIPTATFAADLSARLSTPVPDVVLPPKWYGVQGVEANVYLDNLFLDRASDYLVAVTGGGVGALQDERLTWTPAGAVAAANLTMAISDRRTATVLATKTINRVAVASTAGSGTTKKVLMIGDSITADSTITQGLLDRAAADVMSITLYGTKGSGLNKHEGRSGWSVAAFTSNYSDGSGANPFWISGAVDFPGYLSANSYPALDWVLIHLGTNDVFAAASDAACSVAADSVFGSLDVLIASIKASDAGTKVGLCLIPPPGGSQDGFGSSHGTTYVRWRTKRNYAIWNRQLIARYASEEAARIFLVPTGVGVDTVNNWPRAALTPVNARNVAVQIARQSDTVHPAASGKLQIADGIWSFLKCKA